MKMKEGTIVDVRSIGEFAGGHVNGSINIPVSEIADRVEEFRHMQQPIVLCCASGMRSAAAQRFLMEHGIECTNGGSWLDVE